MGAESGSGHSDRKDTTTALLCSAPTRAQTETCAFCARSKARSDKHWPVGMRKVQSFSGAYDQAAV